MQAGDFLNVSIIVDSEDHAIRLAETVVQERLAATAHIEQSHEAYRLVGGRELAVYREWTVRFITLASRFDALCERAAGLPGIVMPGITAVPLTMMHPQLEGWLQQVMQACGEHDG
ncbi:MAG: divalent cation tolerance protein CutA [Geminicoccaceae bacterium]|jgi:uncharacterized protein involved in tolerance to divalent cations